MKKAGFYTLGCKVNQYETQSMVEAFRKVGYEIVNFEEAADVYVINTCTVTGSGDKKSRQIIRRAHSANPDAIIAVVGCYSQISPDEVAEIEGVDIVIGTSGKNKIINMVENIQKEKKLVKVVDIMKQREYEETGFINCNDKTRAFIKIQEGCDRFCSYCIIPYARGPVRSRPIESIISEVNSLADNGFKEVVLTGININSYGKDIKNASLIEVINKISMVDGIKRIRLGSVDQGLITSDFVNSIKNNRKMCPHFHISLQSGSDSVLKRMNRKYSAKDYENKILLLRENISDISITTDVIVGFPGETDEEFNETYDFLGKISLTKFHVFKYSKRKGTPAADFPNQVNSTEKERRSKVLIELSEQQEKQFYNKFIGLEMEVLFEQESNQKEGFICGHTDNFIKVLINTKKELDGELGKVRIESVQKGFVEGRLTD